MTIEEQVNIYLDASKARSVEQESLNARVDEALVRVRDYRPPDPVPPIPNKLQVITMWDVVSWTFVILMLVAACANIIQQHCH